MLALLRTAAREPWATAALAAPFGAGRVADAVARDWLQAPTELCRDYRLVSGEIEVTAHCNWGCRFCPVTTDPKPRRTMPMDLFEEVIEKLAAVGTIDYVTFQFFNEPTLDRHFTDRVEVLARYGMQLALYSNASALTQDKIDALKRHGVLRHLIVNLPSVDEAEFARLTGSRSYPHTVRNLKAAIDAELRVQIVVNGTGEDLACNLDVITRRYRGASSSSARSCPDGPRGHLVRRAQSSSSSQGNQAAGRRGWRISSKRS
ncbi:radical SAM protein [Streptomyces lydicus]|uniref:radical SAM protein n=1 Tax=Streptomyces lydicus TaxID=47763 RepID=UPI0037961E72